MKKTKTTRTQTYEYVISLIVSTITMLIAACFVLTAVQYAFASYCVSNAEREGETLRPVAGGQYVNWSENDKAAYNAAMEDKKDLIDKNDIAKCYSDLSGSVTGQIIRVLLPIAMLSLFCIAAIFFRTAVIMIVYRTVRWNKHRIAEKKAKEAEEPEILDCVKAD